jgi:dTDP-4-dehydrorhamnose reductase
LLAEHFIVRTGFVFGAGGDFLSTAIARLGRGETVGALIDRFGSPTYVHHLAERLFPLLLSARFGTYHLAGPQRTCWYDLLLLAKKRGSLAGTVELQTAEDLALPAPRPTDSSLTSVLLPHLDVPAMPPLEAALAKMASGEGKP